MVQRQGSGFGFANIPKGGIADLVKAPTITPARVSSFSPVPTLRRRKEPRKGLKGAVLGSVSPFLGDGALSGIGKILPGLYRSEEDILARYGLSPSIPDDTPIGNVVRQQTLKDVLGTDPIYASERAKAALGVGDLIASADPFTSERIKRSALVDKALPRKIPKEKILSNLEKYGNTSAATIPLMMDEAIRNNRIKQNDIIATSGFGAGLSWGAALIKWG